MAAQCELTGKRRQIGNRVSHSKRRTKHAYKPNLQTVTLIVDGRKVRMVVSTQAIRTLKKNGMLGKEKTPAVAPVANEAK